MKQTMKANNEVLISVFHWYNAFQHKPVTGISSWLICVVDQLTYTFNIILQLNSVLVIVNYQN